MPAPARTSTTCWATARAADVDPTATLEIPIAGRYGIPTDAPAAVINATIAGPQSDGYATIYPCGTIPEASSLNYRTGHDIPNELITKLSPTGTICIYTYATTNIIIDTVGYVS